MPKPGSKRTEAAVSIASSGKLASVGLTSSGYSKSGASSAPTKKRRIPSEQHVPLPKRHKALAPLNKQPRETLDVFVFGNGENAELGLGAMKKKKRHPTVAPYPYQIETLHAEAIIDVAVGGMHSAALTLDNRIFTWGVNDNKALGRDTAWEEPPEGLPDDMSDLNPLECTPACASLDVLGLRSVRITQIAASDSATFGLTEDGRVFGWGSFRASDGLFGFLHSSIINKERPKGSELLQATPTFIPGLPPIQTIACGANHVLALSHSGDVFAWGAGEQFELGRRILERRRFEALIPHPVGLRNKKIVRIFAGSHHNFVVDNEGRVYSWGLNNFGQTGIPANDDKLTVPTPTIVESLAPYRIRHIAGGSHHSLACTEDGQVLAWGRCDDYQMGIPIDTISRNDLVFDSADRPRILNKPTVVPDLKARFVAAGIDNSMAITEDGKLYAWGFSSEYRTGLGTEDSVESPTLAKKGDALDAMLQYVGSRGQFSVAAGLPSS